MDSLTEGFPNFPFQAHIQTAFQNKDATVQNVLRSDAREEEPFWFSKEPFILKTLTFNPLSDPLRYKP